MVKSFRSLRKANDDTDGSAPIDMHTARSKNLYKYSMYMQSRDMTWLSRNIQKNQSDEEAEPIEEDIRD